MEAFTPALWDRLGPARLPSMLVVDAWPIQVRDPASVGLGWPLPLGAQVYDRFVAYTVASIVGKDDLLPSTPWRPVLLTAVPGAMSKTKWQQVFSLIPGHPIAVTADGETTIPDAVAAAWPPNLETGEDTPRMLACLAHLATAFRKRIAPARLITPTTDTDRQTAQRLWAAHSQLGQSITAWETFLDIARTANHPAINRWIVAGNRDQAIANQLALPRAYAQSNAAAEEELRWLKGQWAGRAGSYRNAARTNLLLRLATLHRRGADDVREWSRVIRSVTGRHGGTSPTRLRAICDHGHASLRP